MVELLQTTETLSPLSAPPLVTAQDYPGSRGTRAWPCAATPSATPLLAPSPERRPCGPPAPSAGSACAVSVRASSSAAGKRAQSAAAARRRRRLMRVGGWTGYVDPGPARQHALDLHAAGLSLQALASLTGHSTSVLAALVYPAHANHRRFLHGPTAADILGAHLGPDTLDRFPARTLIPACGTQRRLQALAVVGWSLSQIGSRLGVSKEAVAAWRSRARVTARTARGVRDLYDDLCTEDGGCRRTARAAAAAGWHGPWSWTDEGLDDPGATPPDSLLPATVPRSWTAESGGADDIDQVAVERACAGDRPAAMTSAERVESVRVMTARAWPAELIAEILGVTVRTVERARNRLREAS